MTGKPVVAVLLSTFNGERYLTELLESVQAQQDVEVTLHIRDDGSADGTPRVLEEYCQRHSNCTLILGPNLGVNSSFRALLEGVETADYYAFCDQDDVWLPKKLSRALQLISECPPSSPVLYGSRVTVVDADLKILGGYRWSIIEPSIENAMLENIMPGCTMVMNSRARDILIGRFPLHYRMYDWWIYQVIAATGTVVRDPESHILYRQHLNNTVGASTGPELWRRRLNRFTSQWTVHFVRTQAEALLEIYGKEMTPYSRSVVAAFVDSFQSWRSRLAYATIGPWHRSRPIDGVVFRLQHILNAL